MGGKANRDRGNRYEVELAAYLTEPLDVEVITTRNGRAGAQGGADLASIDGGKPVPHVRGWAIEAKARKDRAVPTWLRQARDAAAEIDTEWWCVVHRNDGCGDRGTDTVYLPSRMLLDFMMYQEPTVDRYDPDLYLTLTLADWCEVVT